MSRFIFALHEKAKLKKQENWLLLILTDNNPWTDLQVRQRAPQKQLSRCLENRTRIESPMSEISDEEVDYGSFASIANPDTDSDRSWTPL